MELLTPLTGDPDNLIVAAQRQQDVARAIGLAAQQLRGIGDGDLGIGDAVDALGAKSGELSTLIIKAQVRFADTADALIEYAHKLASAQQRAQAAITKAHAADEAGQQASARQNQAHADADGTSAEQTEQHQDLLSRALQFGHQVAEHAVELGAATAEYGGAVADKEAAAVVAIAKIHAAADASGLSDNLFDYLAAGWEGLMQWVRDNAAVLAFIESVLDVIAQWAGFFSGIFSLLALIPGLGVVFGPLALITRIISLVAGLAALVLTLLLVISGSGKKTVGDLIGQSIGFATNFIPGGKLGGNAIGSAVAQTAGRATGRRVGAIAGQAIEEGVSNAVNYGGAVLSNVVDASINVTNPDSAQACPISPPSPIALPFGPKSVPMPSIWDPTTTFDMPLPGSLNPIAALTPTLNPELIGTIGCRETVK